MISKVERQLQATGKWSESMLIFVNCMELVDHNGFFGLA